MSQSVCNVTISDEVFVTFGGLNREHMTVLSDKYAVYAEGYRYHPLVKIGKWDGKHRFFYNNGKTYLYLLPSVLKQVVKWGYKVQINDTRPVLDQPKPIDVNHFSSVLHPDTKKPITLYDYQADGVNLLYKHGSGVIEACTGAGKTLLSAALVDGYGKLGYKTVTIVPNEDLIRNTKQDFINCGLDTGEYSGKSKDLEHSHIVSTWQALQHNPMVMQLFDVVLVDECHGAKGPVLQDLLKTHGLHIPFRFGITGTIPKAPADQMTILTALGPIRKVVTAADLIERGILSSLEINVLQLEEDLTKQYQEFLDVEFDIGKPPSYAEFKRGYFPDYSAEKSYIHRNADRIAWLANRITANRDKYGNTLVLVDSIPLARALGDLIPGSRVVNGKDMKKSTDRQQVYDEYKVRDDLITIATVHIAGTGLNIRRVFCLMLVDLGKSFTRVIQSIGRGLRTAHDKKSVIVEDITSDLEYGKRHLKERIGYYNEAKYPFKKQKVQYRLTGDANSASI